MTANLDKAFQISTTEFVSKFNGDKYKLIDFKFVPDKEQ